MDVPLTMNAGAGAAEITGGDLLTVTSLRYEDVELLVDPADLVAAYRVHGTRAGITLLHPWANRLGEDVYEFDGRRGQLDGAGDRVTRDANGLAIHGLTASHPWHLTQEHSHAVTASLNWQDEPEFPFDHRIAVRFTLDVDPDAGVALRVRTVVTALAGARVPISFGWHPYFRRVGPTEIDLPQLSRLDADERGLPTGLQVACGPVRTVLADENLDFGVAGLSSGSQMLMGNPQRKVTVQFGDGYSFGQVFAPDDAPVVSLEPMTAPTDALERGTDLPVAAPERPYTASFVVRVSATPAQTT